MNTLNTSDWETIARYITKEMPENERNEFELKLEKVSDLRQFVLESEISLSMNDPFVKSKKLDTNKAWSKMAEKIEQENKPKIVKLVPIYKQTIFKIAAILVLTLFISSLIVKFYPTKSENLISYNKEKEVLKVVLSDQSMVDLNAESEIEYTKLENQNIRAVKLKGEAFFNVKRDTMQPFVITTNSGQIRVLGTSFNVNTRNSKGEMEVSVKSGKVKVSNKKGESITIVANEKVILTSNGLLKEIMTNENYMAWKTKKMVFNNQPSLKEVISLVSQVYHTNIIFDKEIGETAIGNTTFDNLTLDQILVCICTPFDLKVNRNNEKIILSKK